MIKQVAPSVFDEMYRNYIHQGCNVTLIDDDKFFGTELCVDGEIIARRVRPAMWKDENTPGYKKPEKNMPVKREDSKTQKNQLSLFEYLWGLAFVVIVTYIFTPFMYFVIGLTEACFFTPNRPFTEKPWYYFILDLIHLWPVLTGLLWTYIYGLKRSNPDRYHKIVGGAKDIADDIFDNDGRKKSTTKHYFFWTNF